MNTFTLNQIKNVLPQVDIIAAIEEGFVAYSTGNAIMPPVGELKFKVPPGDVHIKYGYIAGDDYYVIKVASGFYDNPILNLPSSNGLMMLFRQKTGELATILFDEGYLTDLRTAAAGAIAAKYLAPREITQIGIIGTGTQARNQLLFLKNVISCRDVMIFGRDYNRLLQFQMDLQPLGFKIRIAQNLLDLTTSCNLIVTTTPSTSPILFAEHVKKGTHITAVGADTPHKQELHENLFVKADLIVADSISQCMERGDIYHAISRQTITSNELTELGNIVSGKNKGRTNDEQITIADLTGLAVQDLQIAKVFYEACLLNNTDPTS